MNIPTMFKSARKTKHLTQKTVTKLSGVAQADLSRFENGKSDIRLSTLEHLADAVEMRVVLIPKEKLTSVNRLIKQDEQVIEETQTPLDKFGVPDE